MQEILQIFVSYILGFFVAALIIKLFNRREVDKNKIIPYTFVYGSFVFVLCFCIVFLAYSLKTLFDKFDKILENFLE